MSLVLVTAPLNNQKPVSLQEIKDHCRATGDEEDSYLESLINAACAAAEDITHRRFITQTWDYFLPCWPCSRRLELPYPPIQSVTSVKYRDGNGTLQTMSASDYEADLKAHVGAVVLKPGFTMWPDLNPNSSIDRVEVRFVCGYGVAQAVPDPIKQAIKFLVAQWYRDREPVAAGIPVNKIPNTFEMVLASHRIYSFY